MTLLIFGSGAMSQKYYLTEPCIKEIPLSQNKSKNIFQDMYILPVICSE